MKKILLLGGSPQQIVAIETAKRLGIYTVLCDYLPDNPGKDRADKFYLESTTDKEKMLEIARNENIDGVLAYASDPAAPTAAYVAEALGLPTNPYRSVDILCNKDKFRKFLSENGFSVPRAGGFSDREEALGFIAELELPIIIKPVDSSGSKGVSVIRQREDAAAKVDFAFSFSRSKRIVVEEFIEKSHKYLVGGDVFILDGKICLRGLLNCHRDKGVNGLVPVGKSYPLALSDIDKNKVISTLNTLVDKLKIKNGAMNVELIIGKNGEAYLIDVGPRNGGNMIPDLLGYIFGVDVVEMTVRCAMGMECHCDIQEEPKRFMATHNLHTSENGGFCGIEYSDEIKKYIIGESVYKNIGDSVEYFDNASKAIGIVFMRFEAEKQMSDILDNISEHVKIKVKGI